MASAKPGTSFSSSRKHVRWSSGCENLLCDVSTHRDKVVSGHMPFISYNFMELCM